MKKDLSNRLTGLLNMTTSISLGGLYIWVDYFKNSQEYENPSFLVENFDKITYFACTTLAIMALDGLSDIITGQHHFLLTRRPQDVRNYLRG